MNAERGTMNGKTVSGQSSVVSCQLFVLHDSTGRRVASEPPGHMQLTTDH